MSGLLVEIEARDGAHRMRLVGDLDLATVPILFDGASRLVSEDGVAAETASIDLEQLSFVDARGLRALLALRQKGFRLHGANGVVRRVFELANRREALSAAGDARPPPERPRDRARSLEQEAQRYELVAQRFQKLGEARRARQAREFAAACQAEANRWRLLAR